MTATVAVCFYGFKPECERCLAGVLAACGDGCELILVDDGSPDDTASRLDAFRDAHPDRPIRVIRHPQNVGLSAARNSAVAAATGDVVVFTSSDCVPDPGWVRQFTTVFADPTVSAASGATLDHPPRTWGERAFVGSTRLVPSGVQGRPLIGNNMAFRRSVLLAHPFDPAMRYYGDEDELAWRLAESGHRFVFTPTAVVRHDHPMTLRQYLRQATHQGQGSARLWYKQGRYVGRDVLPLTLALLTLPLGFVSAWLLLVPAFFLAVQLAALVFNQWKLKGKSFGVAVAVLPIEAAYIGVKAVSVCRTLGRILLGREPQMRESKRQWQKSRRASAANTASS